MSSVLDVVDAAVGDADSISAKLRQMDAILAKDVNATDITTNIGVRLHSVIQGLMYCTLLWP